MDSNTAGGSNSESSNAGAKAQDEGDFKDAVEAAAIEADLERSVSPDDSRVRTMSQFSQVNMKAEDLKMIENAKSLEVRGA